MTAPSTVHKTGPAAVFFLAAGLALASAESVDLNLHLQGLEEAAPPEIFDDAIIFTYRSSTPLFIVGARFSHENFQVFHTFNRNENDVYVLALPLPEESGVIKYRLMVDGVWMADPANPESETDQRGTVFSLFSYVKTENGPLESPRLLGGGEVEFSLQMQSGEIVTIAGDFNGYDPFILRLKETRPGIYSVRLKLLPGRHLYYYVVDGVSFVDPRNGSMVLDADWRRLSLVTVP
jgi:hypothetical protein